MEVKNKGRIQTIDSFRGIAALIVIIFHVFGEVGFSNVNYGLTGVDLFFIISGFVIFLTLNKCDSWKVFVASRAARLYPVYWTCVTLTAILIYVNVGPGNNLIRDFLANLTMFQHYVKIQHLDFPYWTLTVEMQFYIIMLLLFQASLLNRIEMCCTVICVFIVIYATLIKSFMPGIFHFLNNAFPLLNHFPLFFAGILFYQLKFKDDKRLLRWCLLAGCFLLTLYTFTFNDRSNFLPHGYVYTIAIYFLLFSLYVLKEKALSFLRPFVFVGTISYSLYLVHQYIAFNFLIPFFERIWSNDWLTALSCILVLFVIATAITFLVEKAAMAPFKAFLLKALRYKKVKPAVLKEHPANI